jgi:hypothetical protein
MDEEDDIWELFYACIAMHNFIRLTDPAVDFDLEAILDCQQIPDALTLGEMNEEVVEDELQPQDSPQKVWRDTIAWEMWVQYVEALVERQIQQQN